MQQSIFDVFVKQTNNVEYFPPEKKQRVGNSIISFVCFFALVQFQFVFCLICCSMHVPHGEIRINNMQTHKNVRN